MFLVCMLCSSSTASPKSVPSSSNLLLDRAPKSSSASCDLSDSLDKLTAAVGRIGDGFQAGRSGRRAGLSVEDQLDALQDKVDALQAEVALMKSLPLVGHAKVYFNVLRQRQLKCHGCVVDYDSSSADTHGAFDLGTGTFVAPVTGHYFMQFHALVESGYEAQVRMK